MTKKRKATNVKIKPPVLIPRWRFYIVTVGLFGLCGSLVVHLALTQVVPGRHQGVEFLQRAGDSRTDRVEIIPGYRGIISDRNGEPLAVSTPLISVSIDPRVVYAQPQHWQALANAAGYEYAEFKNKLQRYANHGYMSLAPRLPPADAEKITKLGIPGVHTSTEYRRFYPSAEVSAQLIGFTDVNDAGQEALELAFDSHLSGKSGKKQIQIDANGHVIRQVGVREPAQPGKNLALSIDLRLQYLAYRYLKQAVAENYAESGSAVVLDVETGEVLALVNQPSFNPNNRSHVNPDAVRNRAVVDQMEPGSTVKPFSIMAAIDAGVARPSDVINTSPGYLHVGSKTFVDPVNYGPLDINGIIKKSSQVGTIKLALAAGPEPIRNMYANVGFGEALGTGFPGESAGVLPNHRRWPEVTKANYAFGYGFTASVLQLAQAYSVIANGGIKKPVSLLRTDQAPTGVRVVDQDLAVEMQQMLASVLEKDGTGKRAKLAHYSAAGKSGTAHLIGDSGYADNRYRSLFAGFAPLEDPKIVVVAVISEPKSGKYYGGEVAAPVFSDIAQAALRLLEVPPNVAQPQLAGGGQ